MRDVGLIPGSGRSPGIGNDKMATHSTILAWRIPTDRGAWRAAVHGVAKNWTQLRTTHTDRMEWLHVHTQGIYIKAIDSEVYIQF